MFKERGNWRPALCDFNFRSAVDDKDKIIGKAIKNKYLDMRKWVSSCLLCALIPREVIFPEGYDQKAPTTLHPIHNCWYCNVNTIKESPYLLIELCKYVDPVILESVIDDYCKNLNEIRKGICYYV